MLCTDLAMTVPRDLIVQGMMWIDYLNEIFPFMENWIDERNTVSFRWLKMMGFFFPGETFSNDITTFHRFIRGALPE